MKLITLCCAALVAALPLAASADNDKTLQSIHGRVAYQRGSAPQKPLAANATVVLADRDYAMTGSQSQGAVTLADSSRVTMGSDTKVQLAFFNQAAGNNAKFLVLNGRTRFEVQHPNGARANYVFSTPTADIAVRGTEGDIAVSQDQLQVNVYGVSDPKLPVAVTFTTGDKNGQTVVVNAGQSLVASYVNGIITTQTQTLTDQVLAPFNTEFGNPVSCWKCAVDNLKNSLINQVKSKIPIPF
ncbi:MAG: FecR domain-containing protein [Candidatus Eremiobacteraeota bacterium]|nr:FecR domain-containing protein [Candidatus Eremiobacteraeota bacterium]